MGGKVGRRREGLAVLSKALRMISFFEFQRKPDPVTSLSEFSFELSSIWSMARLILETTPGPS